MIEFFNKVKDILEPTFDKYGFEINHIDYSNRGKDVTFTSGELKISIFYDGYEYSYRADVSSNERSSTTLTNELLKDVFNSPVKIYPLGFEDFLNNIKLFFENEGISLLEKDSSVCKKIEEYRIIKSEEYAEQMHLKQSILNADKAWQKKDYSTFITLVDLIGKEKLLPSYSLKYDIAVKKTKASSDTN